MTFDQFRDNMLSHFRIDLHGYKINQLKRRLDALMLKHKIKDYETFLQMMKLDRSIYEMFLDHLTINVSEFFRDPAKWNELEKTLMPQLQLLKAPGTLSVWSAACSVGAEPYSLAIMLDEISPGLSYRLEATDLDKNILETAQIGKYGKDVVRNVSKDRLTKYFTETNGSYIIDPKIKKKVSFKRHDLLLDEYPEGFNLIACRNVTIYFTREAQDKINRGFANSLKPGGILFIGGSEMIFNYQELGLEKVLSCFYRKQQ